MQTEKEYLIGREINGLRCESVGEYSLPDYNGDVKKLLAVKTKTHPAGKFVGEEALEFSGTVSYEVVYLDAENNTTHAEFSTDYDAATKINAETYLDSIVRTSVSGCNIRLVGPRKLSVKASLDSDVIISEKKLYSIEGDAFSEYEPEVISKVVDVFAPSFVSGEAREFREELLSLEGAIRDEVEVLLSDSSFELASLDVGEGAVTIKGDVVISALVRNAELEPRWVSKRIAYSDELALADADDFDSLDAWVDFSSLKLSLDPEDDGVRVCVAYSLAPRICGRKNDSLSLVIKSYVKERGTENEYADFGYTEHICTQTRSETIEIERPISEIGIENPGDVIYSEGQARIEKCDVVGGKLSVDGEVRFGGIMCHAFEDGCICSPFKFTATFSKNVNIDCQIHDNMRVNCAVNTNDVKITFDENNAHASANLDLFVTISSERRQRCLASSYLTDEEYTRDASVVTVYYPDPSESLFSIAEKFHTSVASIAEGNRLTESVFASSSESLGTHGIKKLLIK